MLPRVSIEISGTTMLALLRHLDWRPGAEPSEAADEAIRDWLVARGTGALREPSPVHGYQWKELFLPAGTRLRTTSHLQTCIAEVVGDEILHDGRSVSPNQFAAACAGAPRNAWHAVALLFPGAKFWKIARVCMNELKRAEKLAAESAVSAAAPPVRFIPPALPEQERERRAFSEERRKGRNLLVGEDYEEA